MRSARLLQLAVAIGGLVPVGAGLAGMVLGAGIADGGSVDLDSHVRYLSGLLLAIGVAYWSLIPRIQHSGATFRLLTILVVTGGLGRLLGVLLVGLPSPPMLFGLVMELGVTPALCLWQWRVSRR